MQKFLFSISFLIVAVLGLQAQNCTVSLTGQVIDSISGEPLPYASICLDSSDHVCDLCNDQGSFHLHGLCVGQHYICVHYVGFPKKCFKLTVRQNEHILIQLQGEELQVETVEISTLKQEDIIASEKINQKEIADQANNSLGDQLSNIVGVEVLRTGATIDKPIIHGLYGNRIAILNNGVAQSGQQWGNDHAPEIDPMVAEQIRVVKSVGSLAYMSSSLGAIVLIEPGRIQKRDKLHGQANYILQTNGWGHTANLKLEKYNSKLPWRATASFKRMGDLHTANYYLNNTGLHEANLALQVEKNLNNWRLEGYYSLFSNKIGVLRGAQIGNLTDLERALSRETPFYTEPNFSYQVEAPHQRVFHHLLKFGASKFLSDAAFWQFNYALQVNHRKEFDIRRGGRTERPALNLLKLTHLAEAIYQHNWRSDLSFKTGAQASFTDNTNIPGTGVLPLIPGYFQYDVALFALLDQQIGKLKYELALRASNHFMDVYYINSLRQSKNAQHLFWNWNAAAALDYQLQPNTSLNFNLGYVERHPSIAELYSFGLHQGVSGIEEGDPELQKEKSTKGSLEFQWNYKNKLSLQLLSYAQYIRDYIYLQPQDQFRLTIRGAFPVFKYQQTDAFLYGSDLVLKYSPTTNFSIQGEYSYLRGQDLQQPLSIINLPSNRVKGRLQYQIEGNTLKNTRLEINGQYIFQQEDIAESQDFVAAPPAYFLLGAKISTEFQVNNLKFRTFLKGENLLNQSYRDYLNRQRYFADDLGINIVLGINMSF